jgi:hypothetical protein
LFALDDPSLNIEVVPDVTAEIVTSPAEEVVPYLII